jgi:hypothetical protein
MSLWRQRNAIARAVAGQLSLEDDARLRAHLGGCAECRAEYDRLTLHARLLAADPTSTRRANQLEEQRLMAALNPPVQVLPSRRWQLFAAATFALASGVLGIVALRSPSPSPDEETSWRGGSAAEAALFSVTVVTAARDGGPLNRDLVFPFTAQGQVRSEDWVAFVPSQPLGYFRVVLLNEHNETLVLEAGRSVALDGGRWKVFAIGLPQTSGYDEATLQAAAKAAGLAGRRLKLPDAGSQAAGELLVSP